MKDIKEHFNALQGAEAQNEYIRDISTDDYERDDVIDFLISTLRDESAEGLQFSVLSRLVSIGYCDKYLYSAFLNSEEEGMRDVILQGLSISEERGLIIESDLIELMGEGYSKYLVGRIKSYMMSYDNFREGVLLALLGSEDVRIRSAVLENLTVDFEINEKILIHAVVSGSVVWYVRASIAEILGKRKSSLLFDICDRLSDDKNVEVKLSTIKALSVFPESRTEKYLRKFVEDRNLWVKKEAERVLFNGSASE